MILLHLFWALAKVSLFGFGGGYAMLPIIQEELVFRWGWISLKEFADIVAIAEMTPGPIAINAATFVGFKVAGFPGSLAATLGVVSPSFVLMGVLSSLFLSYGHLEPVRRFLSALRPVVISLIAFAAFTLSRTTRIDPVTVALGLGAFALVTWTRLHPIIILILAAFLGIFLF